jgi:hypothetical protein
VNEIQVSALGLVLVLDSWFPVTGSWFLFLVRKVHSDSSAIIRIDLRGRWKLSFHNHSIMVTRPDLLQGPKINLSHVFAGQGVGVIQVGERIWLVTFMQYDLGYFDDETCRLEPIESPFGPKLLTILTLGGAE